MTSSTRTTCAEPRRLAGSGRPASQPGLIAISDQYPELLNLVRVKIDPALGISRLGSIAGGAAGGAEGEAGVYIVGTVVDIGEGDDPVVAIGLGSGIIMIEAPDLKSEVAVGSTVAVDVPSLRCGTASC